MIGLFAAAVLAPPATLTRFERNRLDQAVWIAGFGPEERLGPRGELPEGIDRLRTDLHRNPLEAFDDALGWVPSLVRGPVDALRFARGVRGTSEPPRLQIRPSVAIPELPPQLAEVVSDLAARLADRQADPVGLAAAVEEARSVLQMVPVVATPSFRATLDGVRVQVNGFQNDQTDGGSVDLLIDLGGDDVVTGDVAAAKDGPKVVLDLAGNDRYGFSGGRLASSEGPVAILWDVEGRDRYLAGDDGIASTVGGTALLVDEAGFDDYRAGARSIAYAERGTAVLWDRAGRDHYTSGRESQAAAAEGGSAWLVELADNDIYRALDPSGTGAARAQGAGFSRGIAAGGVAGLVDLRGDDLYAAGAMVQGFGQTGGLGAFLDLAGRDGTRARHSALGVGREQGIGIALDLAGDDNLKVLEGTALGVGIDGGVGLVHLRDGRRTVSVGAESGGVSRWFGIGLLSAAPSNQLDLEIQERPVVAGLRFDAFSPVAPARSPSEGPAFPAVDLAGLERRLSEGPPKSGEEAARLAARAVALDAVFALAGRPEWVQAWTWTGDRNLGPFLPPLVSDEARGVWPLRAAGAVQSRESVLDLLAASASPDAVRASEAGAALARLGVPQIATTGQILLGRPEPAVWRAGLAVLESRPFESLPLVLPLLNGPEATVRRAARAMGRLGTTDALEELAKLLTHPSAGVRAEALLGLAGRCPIAAIPAYEALKNDSDPRVVLIARAIPPGAAGRLGS